MPQLPRGCGNTAPVKVTSDALERFAGQNAADNLTDHRRFGLHHGDPVLLVPVGPLAAVVSAGLRLSLLLALRAVTDLT